MMAAFNITELSNWGYPETTRFIDPMESTYRSKDIDDRDFEEEHIQEKLRDFYLMDAYKDADKIEEALVSYWANGGPKQTPSPTPTPTLAPESSTLVTTTITARPTTTSTKKNDDSKKTTTKKRS